MLSGSISDDDILPPNSGSQQKSLKNANAPVTNEILKAYQVTAFKYVDSKYENLGKIGLALLVSKAINNFSLLLYGKGNAALAQAIINKDFAVSGGRDLYISFYDSKSINWSILFDTNEVYNEFLNRIAIIKLVTSKQDSISFDVTVGEGISAHELDLCEIDIVISGVRNLDVISTLFSSDVQEPNRILRLKIGANKLIPAIDKGLIGMMKGGHRIICVSNASSSLKGGSIKISTDVGIVAHMKLVRIKTKTEKPAVNNDNTDTELSLPNLNFGQTNKESDPDFVDQSRKLELLNRMKVLGKPLVEFHPNEDRLQHTVKNPEVVAPSNYSAPNPYGQTTDFIPHQQQINSQILYNPASNIPSYSNQLMPIQGSQSMMASMHPPFQTIPSMLTTMTDNNMVTTENRQHNSEMRIAISKLQDKIDRIADKMDVNISNQKPSASRHMDAENVFENIKRIIDENESMKLECSHKSDTIDSQNRRINELSAKNQRYLEDSRNVNDRTSVTFSNMDSENQAKILKLEEEKLEFIRNLSRKTSELSQMEIKIESLNTESQNYRIKSLEFNDQLTKLTTELGDLKLKNRTLVLELDRMRDERSNSLASNEEFSSYKISVADNERKMQHNIELLQNKIKDAQNRTEQVKEDCKMEIQETRENCAREIEEFKHKLAQEKKTTSYQNSNFKTEIDTVNREWELKIIELTKLESNKLSQMKQRNADLMKENLTLNGEILKLTDQLSEADTSGSVNLQKLSINNQSLQRKFEEAQNRLQEMESLRIENSNFEKEITKLNKHTNEIIALKSELELTVNKNRELESTVKKLTDERHSALQGKGNGKVDDEDVERQIKTIMNDVYKKIKLEFELGRTYDGKEVNSTCMIIIRDATMSQMTSKVTDESSDDESSDSENSADESHDEKSNQNKSLNAIDNEPPSVITTTNQQSSNFITEFSREPLTTRTDDISDTLLEVVESETIQNTSEEEISVGVNTTEEQQSPEVHDSVEERLPSVQCYDENHSTVAPDNDDEHLSEENHSFVEDHTKQKIHDVLHNDDKNSLINTDCDGNNLPDGEDSSFVDHENEDVVDVQRNDENQSPVVVDCRKNNLAEHNEEQKSGMFYVEESCEVPVEKSDDITYENCNKENFDDKVIKTEDIESINDASLTVLNSSVDNPANKPTEYVPNDLTLILEFPPAIEPEDPIITVEASASVSKTKEKDSLFGSDDDDDVLGFFEQISEKKKSQVKVEQKKTFSSDDDDGLSWLHS